MLTINRSAKLVDVGVDWLTLTTKDKARAQEWHEATLGVIAGERARGYKHTPAKFFGYVGEQCGHIMFGTREDGALVRISSSLAHEAGWLFSPDAVHCTRIDLQVTCELEYAVPELFARLYNAGATCKPTNGRPVKCTLIEDTEGGHTVYVGSRSSMRMGRVYDKGVEERTAPPGRLIRYEIEIKDLLADQAVAMLVGSADVERSILGLVGSFFTERGVPVIWSVPPSDQKFTIPHFRQEDVGSLKWLSGPVATTVSRLLETVGAEQVLAALLSKHLAFRQNQDIIISELADMLS